MATLELTLHHPPPITLATALHRLQPAHESARPPLQRPGVLAIVTFMSKGRCQRLATAATFLRKKLRCPGAITRRWAPPTRYTLRRITASVMKKKDLNVETVNFNFLTSSVSAQVQTSTDYMDANFFNSFSNTNLIAWLNVFCSQKFLNIIIVFKYSIATLIL